MRPLPNGGGTERDALASYKIKTGKDHPDLTPPIQCPSEIFYLWGWFWQINQGRAVAGMGTMLPIPPSEINAWCQLRRVELENWEIDVIWALDVLFRKMMAPE
jgi:hypothetical protein